jgi:hypothetical protein
MTEVPCVIHERTNILRVPPEWPTVMGVISRSQIQHCVEHDGDVATFRALLQYLLTKENERINTGSGKARAGRKGLNDDITG